MDFASISNINGYIKTLNMNHIWKQNVNNPFKRVASGSSSDTAGETSRSTGSFGDERLMSIKTKLKSGQELSSSDLDYLRENYPDEYASVMKLEREKKGYVKELGRCKTKSDARILHMGKITEALSALKSGGDADAILAKLAKMVEAYGEFTESAHYSKLAENHLELAKAIEAEKEAVSGEKESVGAEQESCENKTQAGEETHEAQEQPDQSEQASDSAEIKNPEPQFVFGGKSKSAETGKPAPPHKVKADMITADVKPSFASDKAAIRESFRLESETQSSRGKLDRNA